MDTTISTSTSPQPLWPTHGPHHNRRTRKNYQRHSKQKKSRPIQNPKWILEKCTNLLTSNSLELTKLMSWTSWYSTSMERSNHHSNTKKRPMERRPHQYQTNHTTGNHPENSNKNSHQPNFDNMYWASNSQRRQLLSTKRHINYYSYTTSQPSHRILNHTQKTTLAHTPRHEKGIQLSQYHSTDPSPP